MNNDLDCPYCGHSAEVCHDDGANYKEGVLHEMECYKCEKTFVFEICISFDYTPDKADCLNGSPHNLKKGRNKHWPDYVSCQDCEYEKQRKLR